MSSWRVLSSVGVVVVYRIEQCAGRESTGVDDSGGRYDGCMVTGLNSLMQVPAQYADGDEYGRS